MDYVNLMVLRDNEEILLSRTVYASSCSRIAASICKYVSMYETPLNMINRMLVDMFNINPISYNDSNVEIKKSYSIVNDTKNIIVFKANFKSNFSIKSEKSTIFKMVPLEKVKNHVNLNKCQYTENTLLVLNNFFKEAK